MRILLLLFIGSLLTACVSTNSITLDVLQPAEINLPPHIKKVVIANRSLPEKKELWKNIIEGFLTQENILGDQEGGGMCIQSLANELNSNPRFQAVLKTDNELKGTGTKQIPPALDWKKAEFIGQMYQADALILLESFDSDLGLSKTERMVKKKQNDKEIMVKEYQANLGIQVRAGWRVYDLKEKKIVEENIFQDGQSWTGKSESPDQALKQLPPKRTALNQAGSFAGRQFGKRISPNWIQVRREYYVRKHDDFKRAKTMARTGNWEGAAEVWSRLSSNSDPKVAARACYNMAVVSEILGNLDMATTWANKAIRDYQFKPARAYLEIVNQRKWQESKLKQQMAE